MRSAGFKVLQAMERSALVTRAARSFLGLGLLQDRVRGTRSSTRSAKRAPKEAPPAVFEEKKSGLLRIVHKEAVIRFHDKVTQRSRRQIFKKHGLKVRYENLHVSNQVVVYDATGKNAGAKMLEVANDCAGMDEVVFATPNFVSEYRRMQASSVKIPKEQWHLRNLASASGQLKNEDVDARGAWKITRGSRSIVVAVLDDGVDVDHVNLRSNILKNPDPNEPLDLVGRDFFIPDDSDSEHFDPRPKIFELPFDFLDGNDNHGTPCAGVIAAAGKNGGPLGIAPNCRILAVKIFHADNLASDARVADAIRYAATHADILSCSWSGPQTPDIEAALVDAGTIGRGGKGAAIFCASGNDGRKSISFPANHSSTIAVGASTDQAKFASYSNSGPQQWVVAPSNGGVQGIFTTDISTPNRGFNLGTAEAGGVDGLSTNDFGGTSSATPLAAGVAALVLSVKPSLNRDQVADVLAKSADPIGTGYDSKGHSKQFGFGRVNAEAAVKLAQTL